MRSAVSLLDGVSLGSIHTGCPLDGSCEFCVLKGTCTPSNHTDDCWKEVQSGTTHAGGMNAHVCDSGCTGGYTTHVHTEDCKTTTEPVVHHHTGSSYSGTGCYTDARQVSRPCGGPASSTSKSDTTMMCFSCGENVAHWVYTATCSYCGNTWTYAYMCRKASCQAYNIVQSTCPKSMQYYEYNLGCGYTEGQVIQEGGTVWNCGFAYNQVVGEDSGQVDSITLPYTFTIDGVKHRVSGSGKISVKPDWEFHIIEHTGGTGKCLYHPASGTCLSCGKSAFNPSTITKDYGMVKGINFPKGGGCTGELNTHVCSSACTPTYSKVIVCDDPHHVGPGEPWDPKDIKNHYSKGDLRCWKPCGDDDKHKEASKVVIDGVEVSLTDVFINLDKYFTVYYPDIGDFADMPTLHGILDCTSIRGMGYTDGMSTEPYTKDKFVTLPVNVLWYPATGEAKSFLAGTQIDLNELTYDSGRPGYYTFYCVLDNSEAVNANVYFDAVATNSPASSFYRENLLDRNLSRGSLLDAKHTAYRSQAIDVVGSIGSLAMQDTGDWRYANLFKKALSVADGWLIKNLMPNVDVGSSNFLLMGKNDVYGNAGTETGWYHDIFGSQEDRRKAYKFLPLTMADQPYQAVWNMQLLPGYNMFMDIMTVGNYYGENRDEDGIHVDTPSELYYYMQVMPRYWELNLDTGEWKPVDVYMNRNTNYVPVAKFNDTSGTVSNWYYYVDWTEEKARRNVSTREVQLTEAVSNVMSPAEGSPIRTPQDRVPIGNAGRLYLTDKVRTFVGNTYTYGVDRNPTDLFWDHNYVHQAQKWHFTLGLPSSSVFVYADELCNTENIKKIRNHNSVIVCSVSIKIRGSVWTLEYNGYNETVSDGGGIRVKPNGQVYVSDGTLWEVQTALCFR